MARARQGLLAAVLCAGTSQILAQPVQPAASSEDNIGCAAGPAERACWATFPVLHSPNGLLIHFDDDLPNQGWHLSVNLETPVPPDMGVFSQVLSADDLINNNEAAAAPGKAGRPLEPQDNAAETSADSWDYELLVLLGLGVVAIVASRVRVRLRRHRRSGRRGSNAPNNMAVGNPPTAEASDSSLGSGRQRVRKRVRISQRL